MLSGSTIEFLETKSEALVHLTNGSFDIVTWDLRGLSAYLDRPYHTIPTAPSCFRSSLYRDFVRFNLKHEFAKPDNGTSWYTSSELDENIKLYEWSAEYGQRCFSAQQTTSPSIPYLKYMGTAATTRDLLSLADHLQGPGTPIHFWGLSHGTLIGSYLINMFPERTGRIILDGPVDPRKYTAKPSYLAWEDDVMALFATFKTFIRRCRRGACNIISPKWNGEEIREYVQGVLLVVLSTMFEARQAVPLVPRINASSYIRLSSFSELLFGSTGSSPMKPSDWIAQIRRSYDEVNRMELAGIVATFCGDHADDPIDLPRLDITTELMEINKRAPLSSLQMQTT
ncbi:hypothetical protein NLI96_g2279 [Meripilus lineatus]|uniref:AB hydrolase-1 domain-containing protein n=1 Tax=Meripilus lineatus TaxID=2056292 RepID=A0AAD5YM18_9APHY|nr:hypothetical protein NLI96_g2279 [Physisporinus lineatus]